MTLRQRFRCIVQLYPAGAGSNETDSTKNVVSCSFDICERVKGEQESLALPGESSLSNETPIKPLTKPAFGHLDLSL